MGLAQFPERQKYAILPSDAGPSWLGEMTMPKNIELAAIKVRVLKVGTAAGSERFRLGLYSKSDMAGLIALSAWVDLEDLSSEALPAVYMALVPMTFERIHLKASETYHVGVMVENYSRNGFTFYVGLGLEHPGQPVNTVNSGNPAEMHVFGYTERRAR